MMNTTSLYGSAFWWNLHLVFGVIIFLAVVFLVVWAIKFMEKKELKDWTLWLAVVGILGVLLTAGWGWKGMRSMMSGKYGSKAYNWESMMDDLNDDDVSGLTTSDQWKSYMLDKMQEHMGITK
jgi:phosphoglycerol transferase MdoB-like AlkP superfamily enzyme